jgi:hypothetical protein
MDASADLFALVGRSVRFTRGALAGRVGVVSAHTYETRELIVGLVPSLSLLADPATAADLGPQTVRLARRELSTSDDGGGGGDGTVAELLPPASGADAVAPTALPPPRYLHDAAASLAATDRRASARRAGGGARTATATATTVGRDQGGARSHAEFGRHLLCMALLPDDRAGAAHSTRGKAA